VNRLSHSELQHAVMTLLQRSDPETRQLFRAHFQDKLNSTAWDSDCDEGDTMDTDGNDIPYNLSVFGGNLDKLAQYPTYISMRSPLHLHLGIP
jgi:hypothetical protein